MDTVLLQIKALEQRILDLLQIYIRCRTDEERHDIQHLILGCERELRELREKK
jgi:hypothetical protein